MRSIYGAARCRRDVTSPVSERSPPFFCASGIEISTVRVVAATVRGGVEVIYQSGAAEELVDSPPLMVHSSSPIRLSGGVLPYRCVVGGEAGVTNLCRGAARSFVLPATVGPVFNHRGGLL